MGIRLMVEVMDDAPDSLTFRERYVLLALAENFNDGTRLGWPAYDGDEERSKRFRHRARCSRAQFYDTLKALVDKGALEQVVRGQKGRQAVYRIPALAAALSVPETETLTRGSARGSDTPAEGFRESSGKAYGGLTESAQRPGKPDPEESSVSRFSEFSVPENQTPTPQVPSRLNALKDANAARVGWGVWGEGSANAVADADSRPVAASADAAAGDGLRPRGYAAPAKNMDQPQTGDEEQPPPVAQVLKDASTGTASQRPGVGDLVPKQIQRAQQAYEPAPKDEKPPRWSLPDQFNEKQAEWERIVDALGSIDDAELNRIETLLPRIDFGAFNVGRREGKDFVAEFSAEPDTDPARLRRERLYGLMYAIKLRPLATWPQDMLPVSLRHAQPQEGAA